MANSDDKQGKIDDELDWINANKAAMIASGKWTQAYVDQLLAGLTNARNTENSVDIQGSFDNQLDLISAQAPRKIASGEWTQAQVDQMLQAFTKGRNDSASNWASGLSTIGDIAAPFTFGLSSVAGRALEGKYAPKPGEGGTPMPGPGGAGTAPGMDKDAFYGGSGQSYLPTGAQGQMPLSPATIAAQQKATQAAAPIKAAQDDMNGWQANHDAFVQNLVAGGHFSQAQAEDMFQRGLATRQANVAKVTAENKPLVDAATEEYKASAANDQGDTARLAMAGAKASGAAAPVADFAGAAAPDRALLMADRAAETESRGMQLDAAERLINDQSGAGQDLLIGRLNRDLEGGQPSLAEIQLRQGAQASLENQASLAASQGNMFGGFAARNAAFQGAKTMQDTNMQAAALRAQEYATARGELGNVEQQKRQQGILATQAGGTLAGQVRTGDTVQTGQDNQLIGFDHDNAMKQAQLEAQQRGLNAQQTQFYVTQYLATKQNEALARQRYQSETAANALQAGATAAGVQNNSANISAQNSRDAAARNERLVGGVIQGVSSGLAHYQSTATPSVTPAPGADSMYAPGKTPTDWGY